MNVRGIHQIEITTRCNLRCKYCAHPHMPRAKQDMSEATFLESLEWVRYFLRMGTQGRELNLAGIGESTMHPKFCEWVMLAREAIGDKCELILATNGVNVTEDHARAMKESRMRVWVSLHRPEKAKLTVDLLKRFGVLNGVSADPSICRS
jgi:MoaA/NifB/PqqE/SkfB family radical SAM enzyme